MYLFMTTCFPKKCEDIGNICTNFFTCCLNTHKGVIIYYLQTFYSFSVLVIGFSVLISLALSDNFILNNEYSAKTIHIQKHQYHSKWNSLGAMTPYVEIQLSGQEDRHPVAYTMWEDFGPDDKRARILQQTRTNEMFGIDEIFGSEHTNPQHFNMFINNPWALSVLSSISPVMYLMTLTCVCQLGFIYYAMTQQTRYFPDEAQRYNTLRIGFQRITLIVFGIAVFLRIARQGTAKTTNWGVLEI